MRLIFQSRFVSGSLFLLERVEDDEDEEFVSLGGDFHPAPDDEDAADNRFGFRPQGERHG